MSSTVKGKITVADPGEGQWPDLPALEAGNAGSPYPKTPVLGTSRAADGSVTEIGDANEPAVALAQRTERLKARVAALESAVADLESTVAVEAVRLVGAAGEPAFEHGWSNAVGVPAYVPAGFYKDPWGRVWLQGAIAPGTYGQSVFTLPDGYRPARIVLGLARSNGVDSAVLLTVGTNGAVSINGDQSGNILSLDGASFRV